MATTAQKPVTAEEAAAAGLRALRAALGNLASQFGYSRSSHNEVLLALGADREDIEAVRVFLHAHPPGKDGHQ